MNAQSSYELELSPDGSLIAVTSFNGIDVIEVSSRRKLVTLERSFKPLWSNSGDRLAFLSGRSGDLQLWIWEVRDQVVSQVTGFEGGIDPNPNTRGFRYLHDAFRYSWSPDDRELAFASRPARSPRPEVDNKQPQNIVATVAPLILDGDSARGGALTGIFMHEKLGSGVPESPDGNALSYREGDDSHGQIYVVDTATRELRQITKADITHFHPLWSRNGQEIFYVEAEDFGLTESTRSTQIGSVNLRTGLRRTLTIGPGIKTFPELAPDGLEVAYIQSEILLGGNSIRIIPVEGGMSVPAFDLDRRIFGYQWASDTEFVVAYRDGVSRPVAKVALGSTDVDVLSSSENGPVSVTAITQSGNGATAWAQADPLLPWKILYIPPGKSQPISIASAQAIGGGDLGKVRIVHWRNRRGELREGTVLLPPYAQDGVRYPLIVDAYPSRSGADWTAPRGGNYAWAAQGYVVFRPSPQAPHAWMSSWKSESLLETAKGPRGWDHAYDDVMSGVDEMERQGFADPDRMCIYGHSNGGTVALEVLTRSNRFRCGVVLAPSASNMVRLQMLGGWDPTPLYDNHRLEETVSDYIELSPAFRLNRIDTPILLAAGDKDGDFLLNAIEVYNRLHAHRKPVTFLRYPDQGHVFDGDAQEDFWERTMKFFEEHLKRPLDKAAPDKSEVVLGR